MTPAQLLTDTLGGKWRGTYGEARCPVHDDQSPSLSIRDGDTKVLVKCHVGCSSITIIDVLRQRHQYPNQSDDQKPRRLEPAAAKDARAAALRIWLQAKPAAGTSGELYLRNRAIQIATPPSIRFHPGLKHSPTGLVLPALVAGISGVDRHVIAIHRTFLAPDGRGKAKVEKPKMALGAMDGGAVRLAAAGRTLGLAEGLETALSAQEIFRMPVWCTCGAERMDKITLPRDVEEVVIFADRGVVGERAAEKAAAKYRDQGHAVKISVPETGDDFNDQLRAMRSAA